MTKLQSDLGYHFQNIALLRLALTHPSTKQPDNQRLEFLGDAILEFCISDMLYQKYQTIDEGHLTARRAALVCERTLAVLARSLGIGKHLIMGHGEEQTGGREKSAILADAMEAILAAIYMDGGYEAVKAVIVSLYANEDTLIAFRGTDDKSALQEYTQAHDMGLPIYEIIHQEGPDHDKCFTAQVCVAGKVISQGKGHSKKTAEQSAAKSALAHYQST